MAVVWGYHYSCSSADFAALESSAAAAVQAIEKRKALKFGWNRKKTKQEILTTVMCCCGFNGGRPRPEYAGIMWPAGVK